MKNQNGFSLIELMIVVAIIGILATVVTGLISGRNGDKNISIGYNGISETRCIGGYKFIIGHGGHAQQILNEQGGGIRCDQ